MENKNYEQKKRECWEEFIRANPSHNKSIFARKVFDYAFDRAYTLGKQTETISQEEIEMAAKEFAERECEIGQVDRDALYKGYYHGMKDSLGKQEKDAADTMIQGWVARASNGHLALFKRKPYREIYMRSNNGLWFGGSITELDPSLFPDLTWDSEPMEVEITIKPKKKSLTK